MLHGSYKTGKVVMVPRFTLHQIHWRFHICSANIPAQKCSVLDFQYASFLQIIHFLQDKGYVVSQLLKLCNRYLKQKVQFNKHDTP